MQMSYNGSVFQLRKTNNLRVYVAIKLYNLLVKSNQNSCWHMANKIPSAENLQVLSVTANYQLN